MISDEDEEFEEDEEDKEVARIYNQSKDVQRRLLKVQIYVHCIKCVLFYVDTVDTSFYEM